MSQMIEAYPLQWPAGKERTKRPVISQFTPKPFGRVRDELFREIKLLGGKQPVLSSNIPLKKDGIPYATFRVPEDKGVAVYFLFDGEQMCYPCDRFTTIEDNVWALVKTIESLRTIERYGGASMLRASFTGFKALPPAGPRWWEVLGCPRITNPDRVKDNYRKLASVNHPDHGGSDEAMAFLNRAYEEARQELRF